jgi:indole-3-glycerol phosphate synthase
MTVLDEILAHKRAEVATRRATVPLAAVRAAAAAAAPPRDFARAVTGPPVRIIAEVKRASPAQGAIRADADPVAVARAYEAAGADAVSVLADARYFHGAPADVAAVRAAVGLPVLYKEFVVDPYQVYEARAVGADAVLLIAGTVPRAVLAALVALAHDLGLAALVEVDGEATLADALAAGARIVGINNRDLRTFAVDLATTARLRPQIPPGRLVVSESGIATPEDLRRVAAAGVDAVLVGTALMASPDPAATLARLRAAADPVARGETRA